MHRIALFRASFQAPRLNRWFSLHSGSFTGAPFSRPGPLPLGDPKEQREMEELIKNAQQAIQDSPFTMAEQAKLDNDKIDPIAGGGQPLPEFEGGRNPETGEIGGTKEATQKVKFWPELFVSEEWGSSRIDRFLQAQFKLSFNATQMVIRLGKVLRNLEPIRNPSVRVHPGECISIRYYSEMDPIPVKKTASILKKAAPPTILFQDKDILAIDKPSGLPSQGWQGEAEEMPRLVHRLDKAASGVILLARTHRASVQLSRLFQSSTSHQDQKDGLVKIYLAIVNTKSQAPYPSNSPYSGVSPPFGTIDQPITYDDKGRVSCSRKNLLEAVTSTVQSAQTHFWDIGHCTSSGYKLVALRLTTGRKHQLRVHLAHALRTPIVGDTLYGLKNGEMQQYRLMLHCFAIRFKYPLFPDPVDDCGLALDQQGLTQPHLDSPVLNELARTVPHFQTIFAPLPKDFAALANQFGLLKTNPLCERPTSF